MGRTSHIGESGYFRVCALHETLHECASEAKREGSVLAFKDHCFCIMPTPLPSGWREIAPKAAPISKRYEVRV